MRSTQEDLMLSEYYISQGKGGCDDIYSTTPNPCCLMEFPGVWRTVGKQDRTTAEGQPPTFSAPHHRSCSVNFRARSTSGPTNITLDIQRSLCDLEKLQQLLVPPHSIGFLSYI